MSHRPEDNQPAVYPGPAPARPARRRISWPRQHRGCCGCRLKPGTCGCCTIVWVVGIALLITWGAISPSDPEVYIERTLLSNFNLTTASDGIEQALEYNLTIEMSLRNSNKGATICYRWNELSMYYDNLWLAKAPLPRFCQREKNTTFLNVAFVGRNIVELSPAGVGFFQTQSTAGIFVVDIGFYGRIRSRLGSTEWKYTDNLDSMCWMMVPLIRNASKLVGDGGFTRSKCYDIRPPSAA